MLPRPIIVPVPAFSADVMPKIEWHLKTVLVPTVCNSTKDGTGEGAEPLLYFLDDTGVSTTNNLCIRAEETEDSHTEGGANKAIDS